MDELSIKSSLKYDGPSFPTATAARKDAEITEQLDGLAVAVQKSYELYSQLEDRIRSVCSSPEVKEGDRGIDPMSTVLGQRIRDMRETVVTTNNCMYDLLSRIQL